MKLTCSQLGITETGYGLLGERVQVICHTHSFSSSSPGISWFLSRNLVFLGFSCPPMSIFFPFSGTIPSFAEGKRKGD
uniref:Uncharacterized protein n=1 Tax=Anguilla anguilla TaxID=7936 RepID=A0A0E9RCA9_ANGAN